MAGVFCQLRREIGPDDEWFREAPMAELHRSSLIDGLLTELEKRIISGEWGTGDKIPGEAALADEYVVSRPVVREALARLRERGYLTTTNGLGTFVQRPPIETVEQAMARHLLSHAGSNYSADQLYEARMTIERSAAGLAAERVTAENLEELTELLRVMENSLDEPERFTTADTRFHILVAESTQNPLIPLMLSPMLHLIVQGIFRSSSTATDAMLAGIRDHARILDSLRSRDAKGAADSMEEHLRTSRSHFPLEVLQAGKQTEGLPS